MNSSPWITPEHKNSAFVYYVRVVQKEEEGEHVFRKDRLTTRVCGVDGLGLRGRVG